MPKPIGVQLYTVREALANDFEGVVRRIADMEYIGVEPFGGAFTKVTAQDAAKLFRELGLEVLGTHAGLPLDDKKSEVLDLLAALGTKRLILPWLPPEEFETVDKIKRNCERMNEANATLRANGQTLLYHNHWQEFGRVDGHYAYQIMMENLEPSVEFEIDTYWAKVAGRDPADLIKELGARAPLLHIKDGPAVRGESMVALGDGVIDIPAIVEAAEDSAEWIIVELDECATDMMTAVEKSYWYLTSKGLARGKKN
jgi:sugar phosphate isomerase/epimerase